MLTNAAAADKSIPTNMAVEDSSMTNESSMPTTTDDDESSKVNKFTQRWNTFYEQALQFYKNHGHMHVPYRKEYIPLYDWLTRQRKRKTSLTIDQLQKLASIDFDNIPKEPSVHKMKDDDWEKHVQQYIAETSSSEPPSKEIINWASKQRTLYRRKQLAQDRLKRLTEIRFCFCKQRKEIGRRVMTHLEIDWKKKYELLLDFKKENGHCKVPMKHPLGNWVSYQRKRKKEGTLYKEREQLLNDVHFVWSK